MVKFWQSPNPQGLKIIAGGNARLRRATPPVGHPTKNNPTLKGSKNFRKFLRRFQRQVVLWCG
jgi:hypothetical protein